jgi:hypothetical protein
MANITELYDIERILCEYGDRRYFNTWTSADPESLVKVNMLDFVGWLYETSQILDYNKNGEGQVIIEPAAPIIYDPIRGDAYEMASKNLTYTWQEFLKEVAERDICTYLISSSIAIQL